MNVTFRVSMLLTDPEGKPVESYHYEVRPKGAQARRTHLEKQILPYALHQVIEFAKKDQRDLPPWLLAK